VVQLAGVRRSAEQRRRWPPFWIRRVAQFRPTPRSKH